MSMDIGSFLAGGVKAPSLTSGMEVGDERLLTVTETEIRQCTDMDTGKPTTWDDGNPKMQLVITGSVDEAQRIDSDDELFRRLYAPKPSALLRAVSDALSAAGAKEPEAGGQVWLKRLPDGKPTKRGFNAPKQWQAAYKKPAGGAASFLASEGASAPTSDSAPPF